MANVLPREKQIAVIVALAEGSSIRAIERMMGINRNTIMNLGRACWARMREDSRCQDAQSELPLFCNLNEVWGFIGKKEKLRMPTDDPTLGDVWTFCALDSETKLVPSYKCGKRDHITANAFVSDVASPVKNRPQVSSDGLRAYVEAVENGFGMNVDYGMIIKSYGADKGEHHQERRYSAPEVTSRKRW